MSNETTMKTALEKIAAHDCEEHGCILLNVGSMHRLPSAEVCAAHVARAALAIIKGIPRP